MKRDVFRFIRRAGGLLLYIIPCCLASVTDGLFSVLQRRLGSFGAGGVDGGLHPLIDDDEGKRSYPQHRPPAIGRDSTLYVPPIIVSKRRHKGPPHSEGRMSSLTTETV